MTDISGLSSFLESDEYFTCVDSHSGQQNISNNNTNNFMCIDNLTNNTSISSIYDDNSRYIFSYNN